MRQQEASQAVSTVLRQLPIDGTIGRGGFGVRSRRNRPRVVVSAGGGPEAVHYVWTNGVTETMLRPFIDDSRE